MLITVVQNPMQDRRGNGNVGKDLVPLGEGLVGSKDGRRFFIPPGNELEEQIGALNIHGEITNLVNDEHPVVQGRLDREAGHLDLFLISPFPFGFSLLCKDMVQNIYNIEILHHSPFQVVVQDFQGDFHLKGFQVFPQPVHGKFNHTAPHRVWTNRTVSRGSQLP